MVAQQAVAARRGDEVAPQRRRRRCSRSPPERGRPVDKLRRERADAVQRARAVGDLEQKHEAVVLARRRRLAADDLGERGEGRRALEELRARAVREAEGGQRVGEVRRERAARAAAAAAGRVRKQHLGRARRAAQACVRAAPPGRGRSGAVARRPGRDGGHAVRAPARGARVLVRADVGGDGADVDARREADHGEVLEEARRGVAGAVRGRRAARRRRAKGVGAVAGVAGVAGVARGARRVARGPLALELDLGLGVEGARRRRRVARGGGGGAEGVARGGGEAAADRAAGAAAARVA